MKFLFLVLFGFFNVQDYDDVINYASNSQRMEQVLCQLKYISDVSRKDSYINPKFFLERGGGDCEDFALCVAEILSIYEYETTIYVLWKYDRKGKKVSGHAVVWFKRGEDQGFFSNEVRHKTKKDINWFCKDLEYTDWEESYIKL